MSPIYFSILWGLSQDWPQAFFTGLLSKYHWPVWWLLTAIYTRTVGKCIIL